MSSLDDFGPNLDKGKEKGGFEKNLNSRLKTQASLTPPLR